MTRGRGLYRMAWEAFPELVSARSFAPVMLYYCIVPAVVFVLSWSVPAVQLSSLRHTYPVVPETTQLAERPALLLSLEANR